MGLFGGDDFKLPMTVGEVPAGLEQIQIVSGFGMSVEGALKDLAKAADKIGADEVVNVRVTATENNFAAYGDAVKK